MNNSQQDLQLWQDYKQGKQGAKWKLLDNFRGIITQTARQQSNVRPYSVVEAELKELALKAFDSYDPNRGVKLLTHLTNNFKKLSRENINNQHAIRVPENVHFQFKPLVEANAFLSDSLGREPTHQEIADYTGWSLPKVVDASSRLRKELVESKQTFDPKVYGLDAERQGMYYAYQSLDPVGRFIMEHSMGYNGGKEMPESLIQKKLKLTGYGYNQAKNNVVNTVQRAIGIANNEE